MTNEREIPKNIDRIALESTEIFAMIARNYSALAEKNDALEAENVKQKKSIADLNSIIFELREQADNK